MISVLFLFLICKFHVNVVFIPQKNAEWRTHSAWTPGVGYVLWVNLCPSWKSADLLRMPSPPCASHWGWLPLHIRSRNHESQWWWERPMAQKITERGKITKYARHASNVTQATALILEAVLQLTVLSQMGKDDTCSHLMGCKSWNETSESEGKVLPLLSIDNRYTSCLERKQHTCGVFGLALSVTGITNVTLKNKHKLEH